MTMGYYKRYPRDFLEGCNRSQLTFEQRGAYAIVLDLIYAYDGELPDDPRFIAGALNCSVRLWKSIRAVLVEKGKLVIVGDFITNFRADNLLEEYAKLSEKNRENGAKPKQNSHLNKPNGKPKRNQPEPEPYIRDFGVIKFQNEALRSAALGRLGPEFVASYLDPAEWQDVPEKAIIARNGTAADRLRQNLGPLARGIKITTAKDKVA